MEDRNLDPNRLESVNAPYPKHLETLVEMMRRDGWNGRPLLVEEVKDYQGITDYPAWTGSHRIEAARRAGLTTIPCCVITKEEADSAFSAAGYDRCEYSSWRDAVTGAEGPTDRDRLRGLERAGLGEPARMLKEEIQAQEGADSSNADGRGSERARA